MAFWIILAILLAGMFGYIKIFGKKPCGCNDVEKTNG